MSGRSIGIGIAAGTMAVLLGVAAVTVPESYQAEIEKWRQDRETRLKGDEGWLTVAGLFWLKEGIQHFGSDPSNEIVLPAGGPKVAGIFELHNGKTQVRVEQGATVTASGRQVTVMEMIPDSAPDPTLLALGDLTLFVIDRGGKFAIRMRDKNSKMRREFTELKWYPIKPEYRIDAAFTEYSPPRQVEIPNILGQIEKHASPGYVTFKLGAHKVRLDPILETPDAKELFFIFRDRTSGKETYPSGRFFYAAMPVEGKVIVDFNKAYNPPCAFTPYATCPLPPPQNRLSIPIEAGELNYGHH